MARRKQAPKQGIAVALRVPKELVEAIDAEVGRLRVERLGSNIYRADVIREILCRVLLAEGVTLDELKENQS